MAKISRKLQENHKAQFSNFSLFAWQKSISRDHCVQDIKDTKLNLRIQDKQRQGKPF